MFPRRPPADPVDPRPRSGSGGHGRRPGHGPQRRPDRSDRPGPRLRPRPRRSRQRRCFLPVLAGRVQPCPLGRRCNPGPVSTCAPRRSTASVTTAGRSPSPTTPEGAVVSWADRCAYCAHDLEDAAGVGIVDLDDLPAGVTDVAGRSRASQLHCFINALVDCIVETGEIGMRPPFAGALAALTGLQLRAHLHPAPFHSSGPGRGRRLAGPRGLLRGQP